MKPEGYHFGTSYKDGDQVTINPPLAQIQVKEPYKLPFFFVTGILIGACLGLKFKRVVVIK